MSPNSGDLVICHTSKFYLEGVSINRLGLLLAYEPSDIGRMQWTIMGFDGEIWGLPEELWTVKRWGPGHPPS